MTAFFSAPPKGGGKNYTNQPIFFCSGRFEGVVDAHRECNKVGKGEGEGRGLFLFGIVSCTFLESWVSGCLGKSCL